MSSTTSRRARDEGVPSWDENGSPVASSLRIGDVARLAGTTPRTIRYYEEIGLLPQAPARPSGGHRLYTKAEVERLREVIRLKELLGVTLDELRDLLTAEEARAAVRAELRREDVDPNRRRELLGEALGHIDRQLELVEHRSSELAKLRAELTDTRKRVRGKLRELADEGPGEQEPQPETAVVPAPSPASTV
ncbi:MAG TPA: MerR family transcriptional regulator [Solirubrobacteraceae bacterium]|jgi:DNA-binding transcriptional MerR regulator|nr:MerR family transcriptional regulator [Solirubrobacteraceae bacterium]